MVTDAVFPIADTTPGPIVRVLTDAEPIRIDRELSRMSRDENHLTELHLLEEEDDVLEPYLTIAAEVEG